MGSIFLAFTFGFLLYGVIFTGRDFFGGNPDSPSMDRLLGIYAFCRILFDCAGNFAFAPFPSLRVALFFAAGCPGIMVVGILPERNKTAENSGTSRRNGNTGCREIFKILMTPLIFWESTK